MGIYQFGLCLSCKSDRGTLRHVLSACPQSLQMYTWRHNKVLEVVIESLRAQCETANQQSITAKEPIIQFLKEGECPVRKQKILIWSYWMESFSGSQDISTISSSHYSNRKAAGHCSMVQFLLIELTKKKTGRKHTSGRKTATKYCVPTAWKRVGYAKWFLLRLVVVVL